MVPVQEFIQNIHGRLRGEGRAVRFADTDRRCSQTELRRIVGAIGRPDDLEFAGTLININQSIRAMGVSILDDIRERWPHLAALADRCTIEFLPSSRVTAFVGAFDWFNRPLDKHLIGIDYGVVAAAFLLADALYASDMLELDGRDSFERAVTVFVEGSLSPWLDRPHLRDDPELSIEDSAMGGKIATPLLWFIGLHELGHVSLGHTEQAQGTFGMSARGIVCPISSSAVTATIQEQEYGADQFAIHAILDASSTPQAAWANCSMPILYMVWLDRVERRLGSSIDDRYPPPLDRATRLIQIVRERLGDEIPRCFTLATSGW